MKVRWDDVKTDKSLLVEYNRALALFMDVKLSKPNAVNELQNNFERKFAKFVGVKNAVTVSSGTNALAAILTFLKIKKNDSIILPAVNYPTDALAVLHKQASPIFIDVKKSDLTLDDSLLEKAISKDTKVIIAVHIFGRSCDMTKIMKIAKKHKLWVIEDACQGLGSKYQGKNIGTFGDFAFFSFGAHKPLSSLGGSGGVICFNNDNFNNITNYTNACRDHSELTQGYFSRMYYNDILFVDLKLKYWQSIFKSRQKALKVYEQELAEIQQISFLKNDLKNDIVPCPGFVIFAKNRDKLGGYLMNKGIQVFWHCPVPALTKMNIFKRFTQGKYPVSEYYYQQAIILPLFSFMAAKEIKYVAQVIKDFYKNDNK